MSMTGIKLIVETFLTDKNENQIWGSHTGTLPFRILGINAHDVAC
jgi:hypothetical protein